MGYRYNMTKWLFILKRKQKTKKKQEKKKGENKLCLDFLTYATCGSLHSHVLMPKPVGVMDTCFEFILVLVCRN